MSWHENPGPVKAGIFDTAEIDHSGAGLNQPEPADIAASSASDYWRTGVWAGPQLEAPPWPEATEKWHPRFYFRSADGAYLSLAIAAWSVRR